MFQDLCSLREKYKKNLNISYQFDKSCSDKSVFPNRFINCEAGTTQIFIDSNGDVYPCAGWQRMVVGNINKQSLKDIWTNSESLKEIRSITQRDFAQCVDCEALKYCSRCLVRNYNEGDGDMKAINPHFCDVAFLNKKVVEHFLEEQRNVN